MIRFKLLAGILLTGFIASAQLNISFRSNLQYPNETCGNIWGYVDSTGREYALVGAQKGLSIVDVTNPDQPLEVKRIPGPDCLWREVKTFGKYAYVTTECADDITNSGIGVQIINLSKLPDAAAVTAKNWTVKMGADSLRTSHTLEISDGYLYLFGSQTQFSDTIIHGVIIANLSDPWNPVVEGVSGKDITYIHDGYIRNNTLYGGHIYNGYFSVIDVTQKNKPVLLQKENTPGKFTHNTWLSDDSQTLFTTDENGDRVTYLTAFDISDLNNITELDRIASSAGEATIHNTHIKNDYAISSWYKNGVTIVDAHRPTNLVEVGNYDPYPLLSGIGYEGAWGVYPFLPSGNLIVSSISKNFGLYVLTPTYNRASYLEGSVIDSITLNPLSAATVEIVSTSITENTNLSGTYAVGYYAPGTYSVKFSKPGYFPRTINNVALSAGNVTSLNVKLFPLSSFPLTVHVADPSGNAVSGANVKIYSADFTYNGVTTTAGDATFPNVYEGTYEINAGIWGYISNCSTKQIQTGALINVVLEKGYMDDFTFDFGWLSTKKGASSGGNWQRAIPLNPSFSSTFARGPDTDDSTDCFQNAFVTGNYDPVSNTDYPVVYSTKIVTSPSMDLSTYSDPYISFHYWYNNDTSNLALVAKDDTLYVKLSNAGIPTTIASFTTPGSALKKWTGYQFRISDFITPAANMNFIFIAKENPLKTAPYTSSKVMKAGFDNFQVTEGPTGISETHKIKSRAATLFPNPANNALTVEFHSIRENCSLEIYNVTGALQLKKIGGQLKEFTFDISGLKPGIYFLKTTDNEQSTTQLFIKQ